MHIKAMKFYSPSFPSDGEKLMFNDIQMVINKNV